MDYDATLIRDLVRYLIIGVTIIAVTFTIISSIVFWRAGQKAGSLFNRIFDRAHPLKMMTIILIIVSATLLAFLKLIEGAAVASILSGIAGYILGSTDKIASRRPGIKEESEKIEE